MMMTDRSTKNLIAGGIAIMGAILIGLCSHPAVPFECMGIIIGVVLLAFGGILKGSVQD
jgi:hypothetical protein